MFRLQSSAGRGAFQRQRREAWSSLARVNCQKCWQQIGQEHQASNPGCLWCFWEERFILNLLLVPILILELSLSGSSITLQWSNCRKFKHRIQFPPFLLLSLLWFAFCQMQFVCQSGHSCDSVCVCAAVCFDFILVCDPGASPATGIVPVADTLPRQRFCHKFLLIPTEKGPSLWGRDRKAGNN